MQRRGEMQNGLIPHPRVVNKIQEDYLRNERFQPHTWPPALSSSARKISLQNLWRQKPVGIDLAEETSRVSNNSSERAHTQTYSDSFL